jgi:exopolysaccharide biosynthesis WecB/TagA/CpsF family protein
MAIKTSNVQTLPVLRLFTQQLLAERGFYSFINPASIGDIIESGPFLGLQYFCDGAILAKLFTIMSRAQITRTSFDFTSIADDVFCEAEDKGKSIFFFGAQSAELAKFIGKISQKYPKLIVAGSSDGYICDDQWNDVITEIQQKRASIVIASLGAGKQEQFLSQLHGSAFPGVAFSCGGFFRQTALSLSAEYYPVWVQRLSLRAFYRMYREPHTIKRYILDYPSNIVKVLIGIYITGRIRLEVK